jgi:hypothetical protein
MSPKKRVKPKPIPKEFHSIEAAAEFWDTQHAAEYWDQTQSVQDVDIRIGRRQYLITLEPSVAQKLRKAARKRAVSSEGLANLWLSERLHNDTGQS